MTSSLVTVVLLMYLMANKKPPWYNYPALMASTFLSTYLTLMTASIGIF